jgi:heterodisulfide reductase subunit C
MAQLVFICMLMVVAFFATKRFIRLKQNIQLGEPDKIEGNKQERIKRTILIAFGQKKMFERWIPAVFHFFIYVAFLLTQIELIEIILDGTSGSHRFFAGKIGRLYPIVINLIEFLSLGAFIATVVFLSRRNIIKIARFQKPEMKGWPSKDANIILLAEIILLIGIFSMNGADFLLQSIEPEHYKSTGNLVISSWLGPVLFGGLDTSALQLIERAGWWLHILVVFSFVLYLPYSKHLHIFLSFPNVYFSKLQPSGQIENMPEIMNEVKSMYGMELNDNIVSASNGELPTFGAAEVTQLSWKNLLDAYSCTECGRCTSVCPANQTGKKLSPRKIMMDVRDRIEIVGDQIRSQNIEKSQFDDGKNLFDFISREEIHACTTCNACVQACPVLINPLDIIIKLRRYEILTESSGPSDWLPMFNSIENAGSPWQMSVDRDAWSKS